MTQPIAKCLFAFCASLVALQGYSGCADSSVEPITSDPTRLTWRSDSVVFPNGAWITFEEVWGPSRNSLWIAGTSDGSLSKIHFFDGSTLHKVQAPLPQYSNDIVDLFDVQGLTSYQVWAVGSKLRYNLTPPPNFLHTSIVYYFNGSNWTIQLESLGRWLMTVEPILWNEVYAGGLHGTILRFDGTKWALESVRNDLSVFDIAKSPDGAMYATALKDSDIYPQNPFLLKRTNNSWIIIDSTDEYRPTQKFGSRGIHAWNGGLISWYPGVYTFNGSNWNTLLPPDSGEVQEVIQFGSNGLLAIGYPELFMYFDGSRWQRIHLPTPMRMYYTGIWTDGKYICVLSRPRDMGSRSYVFLGSPE